MNLPATLAALAIASITPVAAASRTPAQTPTQTPAAPPQRPCETDPNYRKFDFWIGDWDVQRTGTPRAPIGSGASSRIERALDGCVIIEHWTPPNGPAGKSFNIFNRITKKWEQYWVNAVGNITHYIGEFRDDGNLYYEADQFGNAALKIRMTFFNEGPNQVRQLGHQSKDGGKTWTVTFDLTYVRK